MAVRMMRLAKQTDFIRSPCWMLVVCRAVPPRYRQTDLVEKRNLFLVLLPSNLFLETSKNKLQIRKLLRHPMD
jgi:hypothetical protein